MLTCFTVGRLVRVVHKIVLLENLEVLLYIFHTASGVKVFI